MRISEVTDDAIIFNNGNKITFDHEQDCCECNYADFSILTPNVVHYDYNFSEKLQFASVDELGFKFGSDDHWIFIPCYSEQNGYYTSEIDIYYHIKKTNETKKVLNFDCQFVEC
jgi:hypothetical protein